MVHHADMPPMWQKLCNFTRSLRRQSCQHMHQSFHAVGAAIGEEVGAVRLRRTKHRHYAGQRGFSARPHVHRTGGEPDSIDADHWASPRAKRAHPSGSEAGHLAVTDYLSLSGVKWTRKGASLFSSCVLA